MKGTAAIAVTVIVWTLLAASAALAQEKRWQEVGVQGTGLFTSKSTGNGNEQYATDTGGILVSYRYRLNAWAAVDASYGYGRNTQQNFSSAGALSVHSDIHGFTGALVLTTPYSVFHVRPYVLAGSGALCFRPTNNSATNVSGLQTQVEPAFLYGGGTDYPMTKRLLVRLEYRGFLYQAPDFKMTGRNSGSAHMAQPSAGIVYRF